MRALPPGLTYRSARSRHLPVPAPGLAATWNVRPPYDLPFVSQARLVQCVVAPRLTIPELPRVRDCAHVRWDGRGQRGHVELPARPCGASGRLSAPGIDPAREGIDLQHPAHRVHRPPSRTVGR